MGGGGQRRGASLPPRSRGGCHAKHDGWGAPGIGRFLDHARPAPPASLSRCDLPASGEVCARLHSRALRPGCGMVEGRDEGRRDLLFMCAGGLRPDAAFSARCPAVGPGCRLGRRGAAYWSSAWPAIVIAPGRSAGPGQGEPHDASRLAWAHSGARIGVSARRERRSPSTHQDRSGCILGGWG